MTDPSRWHGKPHILTVFDVGDDEMEFAGWSVSHPACPERDSADLIPVPTCDVSDRHDSCGLRFFLAYSGHKVDRPGIYRVTAWGSRDSAEDGGEYDAGLALDPVVRILVTGSRKWPSTDTVLPATIRLLHAACPDAVLVHGACPKSPDEYARDLWLELGGKDEPHPADWSKGRGAGFARNGEMVDAGADLAVAFIVGDSSGASHCAGLAEMAGIPTLRLTEPAVTDKRS